MEWRFGHPAWSKDCDVCTNIEHWASSTPKSSPMHHHLRSNWHWHPQIEGWVVHSNLSTFPHLQTCWLPNLGCPTRSMFQGSLLQRCCCARDSNIEGYTINPSSPSVRCNWIANKGTPSEASPLNSRSCWCHCIPKKWSAHCGIPGRCWVIHSKMSQLTMSLISIAKLFS